MKQIRNPKDAQRVATSLEDSTELGIRLALGNKEVDHRTAEVGCLESLAAEFSLPLAAPGVRRVAEEEEERGNGLGVSAREAEAGAAFTPLLPPTPPPRSFRREAMAGGARVWGSSEKTRRVWDGMGWWWVVLVWEWLIWDFRMGAFRISKCFERDVGTGDTLRRLRRWAHRGGD